MSQIAEYIKLIPSAIPNADKIVKSIVTDVQFKMGNLSEDKKAELVRRRVICKGCPFMSLNAKTSEEYKSLTGEHYKTSRKEEHCAMCGCGTKNKTASFESNCGLESWNKDHPNNEQPLKWVKFDKDGR